jgi:Fervidolysin N-terminal prodomain
VKALLSSLFYDDTHRTEFRWIDFEFVATLSFQFALSAMEASKMHGWMKNLSSKWLDFCVLPATNCFQSRQRIGSSHRRGGVWLVSAGGRATKVKSRSPVSSPSPQTRGGHRSGELLVRFRSGVTEQDKAAVFLSNGAQRQKQLRGESGIEKLSIPAGQDPEAIAQIMRLNPQIEFAEPNFLIAHDQLNADLGPNVAGRLAGERVRFDLLGRSMSDPSQASPTTPQPLNPSLRLLENAIGESRMIILLETSAACT